MMILFLSSIVLSSFITVVVMGVDFTNTGSPPYDLCDVSDYYGDLLLLNSDPTQWSKMDVMNLTIAAQREILSPSVADERGLIAALIDLWPGKSITNGVRLIYRDIDIPANQANTNLGWRRHHLWPLGRGWDESNVDALTDIYNKAPADSTVLVKKDDIREGAVTGNPLFFGICGTVENSTLCQSPATIETPDSSESDGKIFAPPSIHRGDVARAMFFFELRYQASLGLSLTDCPPFTNVEFGYLSELLRWHEDDPVSEDERFRNNRGCEQWQGNRNPFVDFPELVNVFYSQGPDDVLPNTFTYSRCTAPTPSPTATPNPCRELLSPGDIPIFLVNSDDPDQVVFLPTVDINPSVGSLFLTDNPWDGEQFLSTEGTFEFIIPQEGILAGTIFGFGEPSPFWQNWTEFDDGGDFLFDIQTAGDNLFLYCLDADNLPNIINGWTNSEAWLEPGLTVDEYGSNASAVPEQLLNDGSVALRHADNCIYAGPSRVGDGQVLTQAELREFLITPTFWDCQDDPRIILDLSSNAFMIMTTTTTTWIIMSSMFVGMMVMLMM